MPRSKAKPKSKANAAVSRALNKWDDGHFVKVFQMARTGMPLPRILESLSVSQKVWDVWLQHKPALAQALEEATREKASSDDFRKFIAGRLPEHLLAFWEKIVGSEDDPDGEDEEDLRTKKRERLLVSEQLAVMGTLDRQRLYLHALMSSNYSRTAACARVGVCSTTLKKWESDPAFSLLIQEIEQAKKDFYESSLVSLVRQGDVAATIYANRTKNRDRGYGERVEVDHRVEVRHEIDELALPLEVRLKLLEALRDRQQIPALAHREVLEVEAG